jgi:hypothetical protein
MGHRTIEVSDQVYQILEDLARQQGRTPDAVAEELISRASSDAGPYYETEDWFLDTPHGLKPGGFSGYARPGGPR